MTIDVLDTKVIRRRRPYIPPPDSHRLDKRADQLIKYGAAAGAPDDLLTTTELAAWLRCSVIWLEVGRSKGYGPSFIRTGANRICYRRDAVVAWLASRTYASTLQYEKAPPAGPWTRMRPFNGPTPVYGFVRHAP